MGGGIRCKTLCKLSGELAEDIQNQNALALQVRHLHSCRDDI